MRVVLFSQLLFLKWEFLGQPVYLCRFNFLLTNPCCNGNVSLCIWPQIGLCKRYISLLNPSRGIQGGLFQHCHPNLCQTHPCCHGCRNSCILSQYFGVCCTREGDQSSGRWALPLNRVLCIYIYCVLSDVWSDTWCQHWIQSLPASSQVWR